MDWFGGTKGAEELAGAALDFVTVVAAIVRGYGVLDDGTVLKYFALKSRVMGIS